MKFWIDKKSSNIPGPKEKIPFLSNLKKMHTDPVTFMNSSLKEFGDFVRLNYPSYNPPVLLLNNPEMVQEVLVKQYNCMKQGRASKLLKLLLGDGMLTTDGEEHLKQRRQIQPEFRKKKIASFAKLMIEETKKHTSQWESNSEVNILKSMELLTIKIVIKTLFSSKFEGDIENLNKKSKLINNYLFRRSLIPFGYLLSYLPLVSTFRFHHATNVFNKYLYGIIEDHLKFPNSQDDSLISLLLSQTEGDLKTKKRLKKIRDQAMTFFLAGHVTTANTLAWAIETINKKEDIKEKLQKEIKEVLGNRDISLEDIPNLVYTKKVLKEILRMYPPAWVISRTSTKELKIAKYTVRKYSEFIISPYLLHRNSKYFENPNEFNPNRWTEEFEKNLPRFTYIPFGVGSRFCIGEGFAQLEATIALVHIMQNWDLKSKQSSIVEEEHKIVLSPASCHFRVIKR